MMSLRRRLILAFLALLFLGGCAAAAAQYWQASEEVGEMFDQRLQLLAQNVNPDALPSAPPPTENDDDIVLQVWSEDGGLLWHSDAETAPLPTRMGFADLQAPSGRWRSFARSVEGKRILQVAQDLSARREMAAASAFRLLIPLVVLVPLLALIAGAITVRLLQPLRNLADEMRARKADHTRPVAVDRIPVELQPVISALNDLLARQAAARQQQRDFLADVAHELRTPLAVVRLQAENARSASDDASRHSALASLDAGVQRATRLSTQLLALARSETWTAGSEAQVISLDSLVLEILAERHPLARQKQQDLGMVGSTACQVCGAPEALHSLFGNLVDNALQHTPAGGRIDVAVERQQALAVVTLTDSGPGIPVEARKAVFSRFVRRPGGEGGGSGLGLAIAHAVAVRHAGTITLDDRPDRSGLVVRVALPLYQA